MEALLKKLNLKENEKVILANVPKNLGELVEAFKAKVEARQEKHRAKMEAKIAEKKIPADKAAEVRARFAQHSAKVNAAVEKAVADGTVTKEEAQEVRAVAMEGRKGHGAKGERKAHGKRPA